MEKENKTYRVRVLKPFRGLKKGDELYWSEKIEKFVFREEEEIIDDHISRKRTSQVAFSWEYIYNFLGEIFEDVDNWFFDNSEELSEQDLVEAEPKDVKDPSQDAPYEEEMMKIEELRKEVNALKEVLAKINKKKKK